MRLSTLPLMLRSSRPKSPLLIWAPLMLMSWLPGHTDGQAGRLITSAPGGFQVLIERRGGSTFTVTGELS